MVDEELYKKIENMADKVNNFDTLNVLMYHAESKAEDFKEVLKELEEMGKKKYIRDYDHYNNVMRNIIGYLYVSLESTMMNIYYCKVDIGNLLADPDLSQKEKDQIKKCLGIVKKYLPKHLEVKK